MSRQLEGSGAILSDAEEAAIRKVVKAGAEFGYGNMIAHLQTAWAMTLMNQYGMSEKQARQGAGGSGYPFAWTAPYLPDLDRTEFD